MISHLLVAAATIAVGSLAVVSPGRAAPVVSLTCSADPQMLQVGQPVSFDVRLSGFEAPQELSYLAAIVSYTGDVLGPSVVTCGDVVPSPLHDSADFASIEGDHGVEAIFLTAGESSDDHIRGDGVFFHFNADVLATGRCTMSFDFADAARYVNSSTPYDPVGVELGESLSLRAVPEPAGWVLLAAVGSAGIAGLWGTAKSDVRRPTAFHLTRYYGEYAHDVQPPLASEETDQDP
jgi:hypothetical protein